VTDAFWLQAALNSGLVVSGVCLLSLITAIPAAWLIERTDLPGAARLRGILTLSYALPSYLLAIAWILLANPSVGWLNLLPGQNFFNIYNLGGVIFIEASVLFTILFMAFWSGLRQMDPALEEAALLAGASPWRVFLQVTAPLLKGHIFSGLIAVGLASLASFGVPAMIGTPARKFVLTTAIYAKIQEGSASAFDEAMLIALEMAGFTLVLVVLASFWSRRKVSLVTGKTSRPALTRLGPWRLPLALLVWGVWSLVVLLPLAALVLSSFCKEPGVLSWSNLSLRPWSYVLFSLSEFRRALANSLLSAGAATLVVMLGALLLALLSRRAHEVNRRGLNWLASAFENTALFCYSLPGTVLALGLIIALTRWQVMDTLFILVIAFVVKFLTLGVQTVKPSVFLIHPSLLEAARLCGAGFLQRLTRIWLPLLKAPLFACALLVFLPCFSELTMCIMLYGPGTENLGVVLYNLQEYADRSSAAVVATLLLVTVILFRTLAGRFRIAD